MKKPSKRDFTSRGRWAYQKALISWRIKQCPLESEAFKDLMYAYRQAPADKPRQVKSALNSIKWFIRKNKKKLYTRSK